MKLTEKQIHLFFKMGVLIKGIDGALEAIAGFALLFTSPESLRKAVDWLMRTGSRAARLTKARAFPIRTNLLRR
jgi:uncharacterized membrane protein